MNNLSIYIHVPFCRRKCNYCDFYSAPPTFGAVSSYGEALCSQIRNSDQKGRPIHTVYFGGGTPSLLTKEEFKNAVNAINDTFDLSQCVEFTVECNPESVSPRLAETWLNLGVNRVSMGVQSFSDKYLSLLGRLHDRSRALEAYAELRNAGFSNINLDLMMALPGQTEEELTEDLSQMLFLSPEHISAYLLKIEPDSVFGKNGVAEAEDDLQRKLYLFTHSLLFQGGYEHYEISNFAKPGYRSKHNTVYWQGGQYLAFGPGASGYCNGIRYHIPADTAAFCNQKGSVAAEPDEVIDENELRKESVFLGLRMAEGIDRSLIPVEKESFVRLLCSKGYANLTDTRFSLTPEGFLISDYVIRELLPER